ncbi:MAG: phytoene/squalene synthase family protein [Hyphomonadaceae bacterium]
MEDLDALVRRVDEDRWLATRFAPADVRERLIAIYAVNYEIARTAETVNEAALGDMRLEWWRGGLEEILQGYAPRFHPALSALNRTLRIVTGAAQLQGIVAARSVDLEPAPFSTWEDVERYLHTTAGVLMSIALDACDPTKAAGAEALARPAALAWGYAGLARAALYWRARGRSPLPQTGGTTADLLMRARAAYAQAKPLAQSVPSQFFPAFGYLATLPGYFRALERGFVETSLFSRKAAIIAASATGRI